MISVSCPTCGSQKSHSNLRRKDRFHQSTFIYQICADCGCTYLNPRPDSEALLDAYPPQYESHQAIDPTPSLKRLRLIQAERIKLKFIEKFIRPPGKILDVGCGSGNFLHAARLRGWQPQGLEMNPDAVRSARESYSLNLICGRIEEFHIPNNEFDLITLWDVLEHLASPQATLERIHAALKSEGVLVLSVPNMASFDHALFGENWIGWDPPRHLMLFEHSNIIDLLESSGFQILTRRCLLGGVGSFELSLRNRLRGLRSARFLLRTLPAISIILWPYRRFSYLLQRGPILTYIVRKR
jgi:SAM-dependent methyltransferase